MLVCQTFVLSSRNVIEVKGYPRKTKLCYLIFGSVYIKFGSEFE